MYIYYVVKTNTNESREYFSPNAAKQLVREYSKLGIHAWIETKKF